MINLLLGFVLTSAIGIVDLSGNDISIDEPIALTAEMSIDATNQDIVDAINENSNIINAIVDAKKNTHSVDTPIFVTDCLLSNNYGYLANVAHWNCVFIPLRDDMYEAFYRLSDKYDDPRYAFCDSVEFGSTIYDYVYKPTSLSGTLSYNGHEYFVICGWNLEISDVEFFYKYDSYISYSMSDLGDIVIDQQRQLDNITFCVVILAFYPLLQDIIKKLGFRKELK